MSPEFWAPLLRALWIATLVLLLIALVVTFVLVFRRFLAELRAERRARVLEAVRRHLLAAAAGRETSPPSTALLEPEELSALVIELASMVRGEMRRRLAAEAARLGIFAHEFGQSRSRRAALRARAARRLELFAEVAPSEVRAALDRLLADPADEVRVAAAEAAAGLDAEMRARAVRCARHDPAFARRMALRFYERLGQMDPAALVSLANGEDPKRLALAVEAAGRGRVLACAPHVLPLLDHADRHLRLAATRALVDMEHPRGLAALERLAEDPDPFLRLEALRMVALDPAPRFVPMVARRLADGDPTVAFFARELLVRLDPDEARNLLQAEESPS